MAGIQENQRFESVPNVSQLIGIAKGKYVGVRNRRCACGKLAQTGRCRDCCTEWRKGRPGNKWTQDAKEKRKGENNPNWKGNKVKITGIHAWIKRWKPKTGCEKCGEPSYDLSNISGEYKRDISDYQWLCRKCHMESDGRMENLDSTGKKLSAEQIAKLVSHNTGRKNSAEIILKYKEVAKLRPRLNGRFVKWGSREWKEGDNGFAEAKRESRGE